MNVAAIQQFQKFDFNPYLDKMAEQTIKVRDVNESGCLSASEANLPDEEFTRIDWDHNGRIDDQELKSEAVYERNQMCDSLNMAEVISKNNRAPDPEKLKALFGHTSFPPQPV